MKLRNMILILCLLLCLTIPVAAEETPAYITLSEDTTLALNGESVTIDLAGYDVFFLWRTLYVQEREQGGSKSSTRTCYPPFVGNGLPVPYARTA